MKELLLDLLSKTEIYVSSEQIDKLVGYVNLLSKWNRAYNLTSVREPREMISRHIMDSLIINSYLRGTTFADVGSGPGLPGIPLAIISESKKFTLIDSRVKRSVFQRQAVMELNLRNVEIINSRVEEIRNRSFDGIISRAFASLTDFSGLCSNITGDQTLFYAMKGHLKPEEIQGIGDRIISANSLTVPGNEAERHLVIFKP